MSTAKELAMYAPAAILVPAGVLGVTALLGGGPRLLRRHRPLAGFLAVGAVAGLARWQLDRVFTEQSEYEVQRAHDGFEVRWYAPRVVAETTVEGSRWELALEEGFRRLAGYVFGGNRGQQHLAMTTPVNAFQGQGVTVTFTMSRTRDLNSLPTPTDERVRLRACEGQRMAVLRARGTYSGKHKQKLEAKLLRLVESARLTTMGPPVFAGYDAPSTLPFLRRVEVWVPIA
jgi:hypothetical protein